MMMTTLPRGSASGRVPHVLDSPVRRQIVDVLGSLPSPPPGGARPGLTAAEIGERLDLHVTTARFHLDQLVAGHLVDTSFVKVGVGRPRKLYHLRTTPLSRTPADTSLVPLTALLAEAWEQEEDGPLSADEAGERWALRHAPPLPPEEMRPARTRGQWLAKIGRAVDLLERWGYAPEVRTEDEGRMVELTVADCPFVTLAPDHPDVVNGLHRGLLRGALRAVGEDDVEISVLPFAGPRACQARIRTRFGH